MGSVVYQDGYILVAKLVECHYRTHKSCVFESQQQSISKTYMHIYTVKFDHSMDIAWPVVHIQHSSILQVHTTCDL